MKLFNLHIIFILLLTTLISCEEGIPRNRPVLGASDNLVTTEPEPEPETKEIEPNRPSGAIVLQADHCACTAGKPVSIGDCVNMCNDKSSSSSNNRVLFFNVELTPAITNSDIKDMFGFCNTLPTDDGTVASCSIEVKNESGNIDFNLALTPGANQTQFSVDVSSLKEDVTYRLTIVENASKARSTTMQLRLTSDILEDKIGGPLSLMPVSQYSCLFRSGEIQQNTGELFITDVNRFNFYFIPESRPEPLKPSTVATVNCHDLEQFGTTPINSPLLEETTGVFTTWNRQDPRFFDLDGDNIEQIHNILIQNMELQGKVVSDPANFKLFFPLEWPSGFDDGNTDPTADDQSTNLTTITPSLGFYMTPFLDDQTFKAYCPKKAHYYSSSVLFKAMREVVGVDTEGLYAAKQDNVCDFLLVKESLLKKIWFYIEGGQHIQPTEDTVSGKQIQFYWPADANSPYIKKSHQRTYTVKSSTEITCDNITAPQTGGQGSDGVRSNFPPHDKRIGCIPVLND